MKIRSPGSRPCRIWVSLPLLDPSSTGWKVGWASSPTRSTPGLPFSVTTATVGITVWAGRRPVWKSMSAVIPIRSSGAGESSCSSTSKEVTLLSLIARGAIRRTRAAKRLSGKASTRTLASWPTRRRPMSLSGTLATTSSPWASSTTEELVAPAVAEAVVVGVTKAPGSAKRWVMTPSKGARTRSSSCSTRRCSSRCRAAATLA